MNIRLVAVVGLMSFVLGCASQAVMLLQIAAAGEAPLVGGKWITAMSGPCRRASSQRAV